MQRSSLSRIVAVAACSFILVACGGSPAEPTADAGSVVTDTGNDTAECRRSRDCEADELCRDGECVPRQTTCQDDTDCQQGQVCRDEACVQDTRTACQAHRDCANAGELCIVNAQLGSGYCERITDQSCQEDGDCYFNAAGGALRGVCEEGVCKGDQFFDCAIANDCSSTLNCTPLNNGSMCLRPCVSNEVCDRTHECNPNLNHCWYNLCGRSSELPESFSNVNNGRLGGACRADAPAAPAPTNCVQDSDCANLGQSARCNTEFAACEVICDGDNSVCGTEASRDWYYCAANEDPSPQNQACGVGPACDADNPCSTGVACDQANTCETGQPCGQDSHCVGFNDGETCVAGQCRSAALCNGGECVDPNLCLEGGTCPVEACPEGFGCVNDVCVDTCLTDDQCTNAGDRCTGTLEPAPLGEACDDNNACEGGAQCTNGRCPLPVGTETGTCEPISGTCEVMAGDGHCIEVNAGSSGYVGLCLAGGQVPEGGACKLDAERNEKSMLCGNGALCAVASDDNPTMGTCHQGCSPNRDDINGTVRCAEGQVCSLAGGYACLDQSNICDPAQRDNSQGRDGYPATCGANTKCGFFGWEEDTGYCVGYNQELPRKAFGEECEETSQCASGAVCLQLTGQPQICHPLCRNDNSITCDGGLTCRSLASLSGNSIQGPYGLCLAGG